MQRSKEFGEKPLQNSETPPPKNGEHKEVALPNTKFTKWLDVKTRIGEIEFEKDKATMFLWIRNGSHSAPTIEVMTKKRIENLIEAAQEFLVAIEEEERR